MTDAKPPAQFFDWATELSDAQGHVTLSEQEAHEIGARLRSMGEKLKTYEDLGRAADDVQLLRMGYAAARLEIESLQARIKTMAEEHADELMVAHLDGRMRVAQPAGAQQPGAADAALPDAQEHGRLAGSTPASADESGAQGPASRLLGELLDALSQHDDPCEDMVDAVKRVHALRSEVERLTRAESVLVDAMADRTSHGQAPAQAAQPAAVLPGYVLVPVEPTDEMLSVMWVNKNSSLSEAYNSLSEAYSAMLAASPQPVACEPLIRQMRYALALPCDRWNATQSRIVREAINAADAWLEGK